MIRKLKLDYGFPVTFRVLPGTTCTAYQTRSDNDYINVTNKNKYDLQRNREQRIWHGLRSARSRRTRLGTCSI